MLLCASRAAADVESGEVVEVSCAGEVGMRDESLAVGGEDGGEIGGYVEDGLDGLEEGEGVDFVNTGLKTDFLVHFADYGDGWG